MLFFIELINTSDEIHSRKIPWLSANKPKHNAESIDAKGKIKITVANRYLPNFQLVQCKRSSCCLSKFSGNIFFIKNLTVFGIIVPKNGRNDP